MATCRNYLFDSRWLGAFHLLNNSHAGITQPASLSVCDLWQALLGDASVLVSTARPFVRVMLQLGSLQAYPSMIDTQHHMRQLELYNNDHPGASIYTKVNSGMVWDVFRDMVPLTCLIINRNCCCSDPSFAREVSLLFEGKHIQGYRCQHCAITWSINRYEGEQALGGFQGIMTTTWDVWLFTLLGMGSVVYQ